MNPKLLIDYPLKQGLKQAAGTATATIGLHFLLIIH